jgi:glutamine synthetase
MRVLHNPLHLGQRLTKPPADRVTPGLPVLLVAPRPVRRDGATSFAADLPVTDRAPVGLATHLRSIGNETVVRLLAAAGVRRVRLEFADLDGLARSHLVPLDRFAAALVTGPTVSRSTLGRGAIRWATSSAGEMPDRAPAPDFVLDPDLTTLAVTDPAAGTARLVCDLLDADGRPAALSPRTVVRRLVAAYEELGLVPRLGFEHEFFLFDGHDRPLFPTGPVAESARSRLDPALVDALDDGLRAQGIELLRLSAERACGQVEVAVGPADGMSGPDGAFAFRTLLQEVAARHGLRASFATKPFADEAASGSHVHQSLIDRASGANAFVHAGRLSPLALSFLAGQLVHAPALTALLAPTTNCFTRYRRGTSTPIFAAWDHHDRRVAVRVPRSTEQNVRFENRLASAAANPYLIVAGLLAAGLDGIYRGLTPPPPLSAGSPRGIPQPLPRTLDEALAALESDAELRELLGSPLVDLFLYQKRRAIARRDPDAPDDAGPSADDETHGELDDWDAERVTSAT